ncbi:MAG: hypothetical protein ABL921_27800 [Pirellula sp.]
MNPSQIFWEATKSFGEPISVQRLDIERYHNIYHPEIIDLLKRQISLGNTIVDSARKTLPKLPPIYFGVVDNMDFNARAISIDGKYVICVYVGAILVLHQLFARMLADQRVLPQIGNVSNEAREIAVLGSISPESLLQPAHPGLVSSPLDFERRVFQRHLVDLAMHFLVCHEIAHIANGHLDFDRLNKSDPSYAIESQTIEMDADSSAVACGVLLIRHRLENNPNPPWDKLYASVNQCAFSWAFAISSFFRLDGDLSLSKFDRSASKYSPARVRQANAFGVARTYVNDLWDKSIQDDFLISMSDAMVQVEIAFSIVGGEPLAMNGIQEAHSLDAWKYNGTLLAWKNELRDKLLPFAFGNLAQPQDLSVDLDEMYRNMMLNRNAHKNS